MTYIDEEILIERRRREKEKYQSLDEGFYIDGKIIKFEKVEMENIFSIILPEDFWIMPEKYAQIKYPSVFRPQYIYTTDDLSVNMGFTLFPDNLETEGTKNTANRMLEAIKRDNPTHELYGIESLQENTGTWFSFRSHAMDCDIYNMILISKISKGILQSNFNCLLSKKEGWKIPVLQIWESIEEIKERTI